MALEYLYTAMWNANNKDFGKCEHLWKEAEEDTLIRQQQAIEASNKLNNIHNDTFTMENVHRILENGQCMHLGLMIFRKVTDSKKCPSCGAAMVGGVVMKDTTWDGQEICQKCETSLMRNAFNGTILI